jgi:hypothetical protein
MSDWIFPINFQRITLAHGISTFGFKPRSTAIAHQNMGKLIDQLEPPPGSLEAQHRLDTSGPWPPYYTIWSCNNNEAQLQEFQV